MRSFSVQCFARHSVGCSHKHPFKNSSSSFTPKLFTSVHRVTVTAGMHVLRVTCIVRLAPFRSGLDFRAAVDWICVCADLEDTSGIREKQDAVSGVAWAPLMARKAECIAVARGSTVRLLALGGQLQGHINANENLQAYQVCQVQGCYHADLFAPCEVEVIVLAKIFVMVPL